MGGNCRQRDLILETSGKKSVQDEWMELCSLSPILWINLFAWTYNVKAVGPDGRTLPAKRQHVPFITWPVQDHSIEQTVQCIEDGKDVISDKSREMGESWKYITIATWYWLFKPESHSLLVSRVEDLVDKKGDPDTLFWKIDYINRNLPEWMIPGKPGDFQLGGAYRRYMQLENPKQNSTITGQATTGHVGRGGRRTFVLFDEMAAIEHATAAWQSAADTTACRVGNSTPLGPGTEFTKQRNNGIRTGQPKVITVGYWDHPEKGQGREWATDEDGSLTGIAGRGFWMTPWLREELKRRQDSTDIGQNILIDHVTSGNLFFNSTIVTNHMRDFGADAIRCEIVYSEGEYRFVPEDKGRWYVHPDIVENDGIPSKRTHYVGFADLSHGKGSSNSACPFMDVNNGMVVAELVDPHMSTHEFAEEVATASLNLFCGAKREAFLGWESNGPGESWHKDLKQHGVNSMYYKRNVHTRNEKKSKEYGWRSGRREKRVLLSGLSRAMVRDDIVIPFVDGLYEMLEYVFYDDGSIGPGQLADETSGARESHGDRVIGYAGCVFMRREVAKYEEDEPLDKPGTLGEWLGVGKDLKRFARRR